MPPSRIALQGLFIVVHESFFEKDVNPVRYRGVSNLAVFLSHASQLMSPLYLLIVGIPG